MNKLNETKKNIETMLQAFDNMDQACEEARKALNESRDKNN